jgi:hypothetical protein
LSAARFLTRTRPAGNAIIVLGSIREPLPIEGR